MANSNQEFLTEIIDDEESRVLSVKLAALNNDVRFYILQILRDYQILNKYKNPLYSREINLILANYNINITPQMLGQHLKILVESGLLDEVIVKKEVPNKVGKRNVKAYVLRKDAFEDLFLDINFFSDELLTYFNLYDINSKFKHKDCCVLTVFNGVDKGKTFRVKKGSCALIGRKGNYSEVQSENRIIMLDNDYGSVSKLTKPHLKLFFEEGLWYVLDESSSNGTYIGDRLVPYGEKTRLPTNSFLKLSKGRGSVVFYCSY